MATVHHAPVPVSMSRFLHFDMSIVRVSNIFPSLLRMPIACRSCLQKKSPSLRSAKSGVSARLFEKFAAVFVPPFFGSNPGAEEDQEEQAEEAAGSRRTSFLQAWRFKNGEKLPPF